MAHIARIYEHLPAAEAARNAALNCGVPPDAIELAALADDGSSIKGNFLAGDSVPPNRHDVDEYDRRFRTTDTGARYRLTIAVDDSQLQSLETALSHSGGTPFG